MWTAPEFNESVAYIISESASVELVANLIVATNDRRTYTPIYIVPEASVSYSETMCFRNDEYISNAILQKSCTMIINCLSRFHCKKIVFVMMNEKQISYFPLDKYLNVKIIYVDSIKSLISDVGLSIDTSGVLECTNLDILYGIEQAKEKNKYLKIEETAKSLESTLIKEREGMIVIERNGDILDLVIMNYALSINADVLLIEPVKEYVIEDINNDFFKWKYGNDKDAYSRVDEHFGKVFSSINIDRYEFVTFFTDGIPYGVYYNNICCTHVLRKLKVDILISSCILYEKYDFAFFGSVIFSPEPKDLGDIVIKEANEVSEILHTNNYEVVFLKNQQATVNMFDQYVSNYPYDLLHIVSHGGEVSGYYVKHTFLDRYKVEHIIEYEEVVGFSCEGSEVYRVHSKKIFKKLDGYKWISDELKEVGYPKYVFEDMRISLMEVGSKEIRTKLSYPIKGSCHIQCYDSVHQGEFNSIASNSYPIVFNNSCSSWREFSTHIINSGCRAYIGTLWSVGNNVSSNVANDFYTHLFEENLASNLFSSCRTIDISKYRDAYIYCGLHFSTLKKSQYKQNDRVKNEIVKSIGRWFEYCSKVREKTLIINGLRILKFLCELLPKYFYGEELINMTIYVNRYIKEAKEKYQEND